MVTIYIVRHCEALGNLSRKFQGQIDHDITEMGAKQLDYLVKRFENVHIDAVYSSPLIRAYKTAASVAESKNLPVKLKDGLKELHVGMFENMSFEVFKNEHKEYCERWVNEPWNFEAPNGEKMVELYERIGQTIKEIALENRGKTVLVASHGCAIRNLLCNVVYGDIERLGEIKIGNNTSVTKLLVDDNMNVMAEYFSDCSHLPKEMLPQSSRFNTNFGEKK